MSLADWTPADLKGRAGLIPALVVDFWADWCPNCKVTTGLIERLEPRYAGRIAFARLDHGKHPEIADGLGIRSLPALVFFRGGRIVDIVQGFTPPPALRAKLDAFCVGSGA